MSRLFNRMDKILLFTTLIMFGYGLFMIFDASSMRAHFEYDNDLYYFNKQLLVNQKKKYMLKKEKDV